MRKRFFERLQEGLTEAVAHERGQLELKVTCVNIPKPPRDYRPDRSVG